MSSGVDTVVITALAEEAEAVVRALGTCDVRRQDGIDFRVGTIHGHDVIVLPLGAMGNVGSAQATQYAIGAFDPANILLVGIAGGARDALYDLRLGDVLIADQVVGYELARLSPDGSKPQWETYRASHGLLQIAKDVQPSEWALSIAVPRPDGQMGRTIPQSHFGPVASGEKVVADADTMPQLQVFWSTLLGVEMEGLGVALAAYRSEVGFLLVKGISDHADPEKENSWRAYAAEAAARFAVAVLARVHAKQDNGEQQEGVPTDPAPSVGRHPEIGSGSAPARSSRGGRSLPGSPPSTPALLRSRDIFLSRRSYWIFTGTAVGAGTVSLLGDADNVAAPSAVLSWLFAALSAIAAFVRLRRCRPDETISPAPGRGRRSTTYLACVCSLAVATWAAVLVGTGRSHDLRGAVGTLPDSMVTQPFQSVAPSEIETANGMKLPVRNSACYLDRPAEKAAPPTPTGLRAANMGSYIAIAWNTAAPGVTFRLCHAFPDGRDPVSYRVDSPTHPLSTAGLPAGIHKVWVHALGRADRKSRSTAPVEFPVFTTAAVDGITDEQCTSAKPAQGQPILHNLLPVIAAAPYVAPPGTLRARIEFGNIPIAIGAQLPPGSKGAFVRRERGDEILVGLKPVGANGRVRVRFEGLKAAIKDECLWITAQLLSGKIATLKAWCTGASITKTQNYRHSHPPVMFGMRIEGCHQTSITLDIAADDDVEILFRSMSIVQVNS